MRKLGLISLSITAFVLIAATVAVAANVHFKSRPPLTFTDNGLTLTASGALTGLGNGDLVIALTAQGQPIATCTNPSGKNQPAGQNPAVVTLSGVQQIPSGEIKNGNVSFNTTTGGPVTPVPGAPQCPGSNWTENITDVIFSGFTATITIYQGTGCAVEGGQPNSSCTQILQQNFTV